MLKLRQLGPDVSGRLAELAKSLGRKAQWTELVRGPDPGLTFSSLRLGGRCHLFCQIDGKPRAADLVARLQSIDFDTITLGDVEMIEVGVFTESGWEGPARSTVARGVVVTPFHEALASIVGLPPSWQISHEALLEQTLRPLGPANAPQFASMTALWNGNGERDAVEWLESLLRWDRTGGELVYLQAEGGKGKSTLLAQVARGRLRGRVGPLPIYLPLRNVLRGAGVSWDQMAATLGVIGSAAENLRFAVRCGVAVLFLDGLDEVSGRYDPDLITEVARVLKDDCSTDRSLIVLSGRTTEGAMVGNDATTRVRLELPRVESEEFEKYIRAVARPTCAELTELARRCPETPWEGSLEFTELGTADENALVEWIRVVFDAYGRDRSLFFVQSLAAIGRSKQVAGNRRLVIHSNTHPPEVTFFEPCGIDEVCALAASLACVREQGKIDSVAEAEFEPLHQLDVLSLLAVCRSGYQGFPALTPNDLARVVFSVDPTNQAEVWIAILRQVQKHALLMSSADGVVVGEWRPVFLSEWVRASLIVRAWNRRTELSALVKHGGLDDAIAAVERGQVAFGSLIPSAVERGALDAAAIVSTLCRNANAGSEAACANYWWMRSGLGIRSVETPQEAPARLVALADMTEIVLDGSRLGGEFSGGCVQFAGARFQDCELSGVRLEDCGLTEAFFERCVLRDVKIHSCDGPFTFLDCSLEHCAISDVKGRDMPLMTFIGCRFDEATRVGQHEQPSTEWQGAPVVRFENCTVADSAATARAILLGDYLGVPATDQIEGLRLERDAALEDPAVLCTRSTFSTFFPRRAGPGIELQSRPYIRSSAIGRGRMLPGDPTGAQIIDILKTSGFSDGGRSGHLYAPWSQVGGVTEDGKRMKNEIVAFLLGKPPSQRISRIIARVRGVGSWD